MKRVTKDDADYGRGLPQAHCGICQNFVAPDRCKIVVGKITPKAWCKFFKRKGSKLA